MPSQKRVFRALKGEREYQDAQAAQWNHKGTPSLEAELLMLEEYVHKARTQWCGSSDREAVLHVVRKVAGIATRCMENHGAPKRDVPAPSENA